MRVLVFSDIHANLVALEAVLADAEGQYDAAWFLGDLVGYGPDPNECTKLVRSIPKLTAIIGNHDVAALNQIDINTFNVDAQRAIRWTQETLTAETAEYLESLPKAVDKLPFIVVHGSPRDPVWEYILDRYIAMQNFDHFHTPYCLVGHTHTPVIYQRIDKNIFEHPPNYTADVALDEGRYIINPGSVGQPRDSNPKAAYALLDTKTCVWTFKRVPYDIAETQRRMLKHDMPLRLVARLAYGW